MTKMRAFGSKMFGVKGTLLLVALTFGAPVASAFAAGPGPVVGADVIVAEGTEVPLPRNVRLLVESGASAKPTFTTKLPVGEKGAMIIVQTVEVDGGRVDAFFHKSEMARGLLLQGPDKIMGIATGGHLVMAVTDQTVVVGAVSGDALVGQDSKFKALASGNIRVFQRASGMSKDVAVPAAPKLTTAQGLGVAMTGGMDVSFAAEAKGKVRVALVDSAGKMLGQPVLGEPGENVSLHVPRAGIYYAVARELGAGGISGALSAPVRIQVLGLAPGQAGPDDGVFLLDQGERVRLSGTDGLEVRYGLSPSYFPATNSIGLSQKRATQVEFRDPKTPDQTVLVHLAPRVQKALVEMGPAGARWPGKSVRVRVGVWDGSGKLMNGDSLDVRVTVNSKKVALNFQLQQDGLVAELPEQAGEGPWVVRVNVHDQQGRLIVRDFFEVSER